MQNLFSKYQALTTRQKVLTAVAFFILGLLVLPNVLVYAASIYASTKLIAEVSFRRIFVGMFSVVTFFSFVLLFAEETPTPVNTQSKTTEETEIEANPKPVTEISTSTATTSQTESGQSINEEKTDDETLPQNTSEIQATSTTKEPATIDTTTSSYRVVSVVDGDTIKLNMNGTTETIRLIGIDTPETVHPSKPVECMGIEASNKAKQLLTGQTVRFEGDDTQGTRDKYGRLLGYVFLSNEQNFGEVMIRSGFANEYTYSVPYKYQSTFKSAEQSARTNKIGLWADGVCEEKVTNEEPQPQPISQPTSSGQKWYVSSHYSSKFYYCEDTEAWQGLSKTYLETYDNEAALKAKYPSHTLHESCL